MDDFSWILNQDEGQFFERKGCWDTTTGVLLPRDVRDVAKDIAETIAAMANADGGTVVAGIRDDGEVTGMSYSEEQLRTLKQAPQTRITPPLHPRISQTILDGQQVIVFELDWSHDVHQLTDGRFVLRINDGNVPFNPEEIRSIKDGKRRRVTENQFVDEASLHDLNPALILESGLRAGLDKSIEGILSHYRLCERRNGKIALTLAALLLFGKDPGQWHPRCGIDFTHYRGKERKHGASLNIIKRIRVDSPLVSLIEEAYKAVQSRMDEPQPLTGLFFEDGTEYPTFAWQEAIVNAVAHRDYSYVGIGIEIDMYDNRLEVRSPGELVEPVTLDRLQKRERVHASRNPRIVRVLTDYQYMREKGEGVPRIFEEMEREGLYPPDLRLDAGSIFQVTLKNTSVYSKDTLRWLREIGTESISSNQKRLLAHAKEHNNRFTSRTYQNLTGVDIYTAQQDIRDLIRKNFVRLPVKRGKVYELIVVPATTVIDKPADFLALEPILAVNGSIQNQDIRQTLGVTIIQATRIASRFVALGLLVPEGERGNRRYRAAN